MGNSGNYKATMMVGAVPYMAPEMFYGSYGTEVDLWNFGLMVHEIVKEKKPTTMNG